jgi:DnaK suppressor protein
MSRNLVNFDETFTAYPSSKQFELLVQRSNNVAPNPQNTRRYEEKLLAQKQLLEESMSAAVVQGRETVTSDTQDVADQAVISYQKEFLFSQGTSGHQQLRLVTKALSRLREGSFGECVHCREEIGAKRLEALPWTPYCIICQEKIENGELDIVRAA